MTIQCPFFHAGADCSCRVLEVEGASAAQGHAQRQRERRYCCSGGFIACPVFRRVERWLALYNELCRGAGLEPAELPAGGRSGVKRRG
jgi:hypothetical protein